MNTQIVGIKNLEIAFSSLSILKILWPSISAFIIGIIISPFIIKFLNKKQLWKKKSVATTIDGKEATITASIHKDEEKKTPRLGGLVIILSVLLTILIYYILSLFFNFHTINNINKLNFISRNQTWLPISIFFLASIIGLIDDLASTGTFKIKDKNGNVGMPLRTRLLFVILFSLITGAWFYFKLGFDFIHIPFFSDIHFGPFIILIFVILFLASYGASNIDGLDGLSGGIFSILFFSYGVIALLNNQIDIAALCFVIVGSTLAFLWFNIPPAKFYLSEVGYMPLSILLAIVAIMTNAVLLLIIIAMPLFLTEITTILQLLSKKFRKKKIFPAAPIHNSFVYIGWSKEKVVMRYWIFTAMFAFLGILIYIIS